MNSTRDAPSDFQPDVFEHNKYDPDISISQDTPEEVYEPRRVTFNENVILPPGGLTGIFSNTLYPDFA